MRRSAIGLMLALTLGLLVALLTAEAQPVKKGYRIGILHAATAAEAAGFTEVFRQALQDLGWGEEQHIALEERYADGTLDRLPDLAAALVRLPVDLLVTGGLASTRAAKHETTTIPIVFVAVADPVGNGLVASLARPGGNLTGAAFEPGLEFTLKRLELLKAAAPTISRVAMLVGQARSPSATGFPTSEADVQVREHAAQALGLTLRHFSVQRAEEWTEWVFPALMADIHASDALYAVGPLAIQARRQLADFALQHGLPLMGSTREHAEAGSLLSYGPSIPAAFRRAAFYVDRLLKGATPADLPVEQAMKFELVINLKTAEALGLRIPPTLLFQADEVIR